MNADMWVHSGLVFLFGLSALLTVVKVGQPRTATTGGEAALVVVIDALIITALLVWWPT